MCDRVICQPPPKRLRISELNPHLLCALCGGYLIDATTIIECLHSFCKTCILRYLETSNYCPICEVLIHKTRPWQNIRLDHSLQNAVYKMVPGLFQNEMRRRREFYEKQNVQDKRGRHSNQPQGELGDRIIFSQDEEFSISIEFSPDGKPVKEIQEHKTKSLKRPKANCPTDKRYLKCPAGLRIEHLKKFIRTKFTLPQTVEIDLFYETETLNETFSLMDVAYIYNWKRDCVLRLFYSFYEIPSKQRKIETVTNVTEVSKNKMNDKSQEKSDKRDNNKITKGKKEKSKEKRQSKLSGKRKVHSDVATTLHVAVSSNHCSANSNQPFVSEMDQKVDRVVATKGTDTESVFTSQSETSSAVASIHKTDNHSHSTVSLPEKCNNKNHSVFQSPTKQKPPPETTSYSIVAHSSNLESSASKGSDSKTSLKLLIKSSDIKESKSPIRETVFEENDKKYHCDLTPKIKVRKFQNGETRTILKSNLFEKMDTFSMSSQSERTKNPHSYSSPFQSTPNNHKRFKASDNKYDIKAGFSTAEPEDAVEINYKLDKVKSDCVESTNIARNAVTHSCDRKLSNDEINGMKPVVSSSNDDRIKKSDVQVSALNRYHLAVDKETIVSAKVFNKSSSEIKQTDVKQEMCQIKNNDSEQQKEHQSNALSSNKNNAIGLKTTVQDSNQNETKIEQIEMVKEKNLMNIEQTNQTTQHTKIITAEKQVTNDSTVIDGSKQKIEELTLSRPTSVVHKEINAKQENVKHGNIDNKKEDIKQRNTDVNTSVYDTNSAFVICKTTTNKSMPENMSIHITAQNTPNRTVKVGDSLKESIGQPKNKAIGQDKLDTKVVINAPKYNITNNYPPNQSYKDSVERFKLESKQHSVPLPTARSSTLSSSENSKTHKLLIKPQAAVSIASTKAVLSKSKLHTTQVTSPQTSVLSNGSLLPVSSKPSLISRAATTTTSFSTLASPPKLLKATAINTTSSFIITPTSYTIASIVSVPAVTSNSIPTTSPVIGKSLAQSTSVASGTARVPRECEVTSTVSNKAVTCTSTATKPTTPLLSAVAPSSHVSPTISASPAVSGATSEALNVSKANDVRTVTVMEKKPDSGKPSAVCQRKLPDTTTSLPLETSSITTCAVSKSLPANTISCSTASSIALPTSPHNAASTIPTITTALSVSSNATKNKTDNWSSFTSLNVTNTFLHIPPTTESSALKDSSQTHTAKTSTPSSVDQLKHKESIKLDNFLYDTKSVEVETSSNSHNVRDSCTDLKHEQKNILKSKPVLSTQLHEQSVDKSTKNQGPHITAIHNLPKTISQTSKPYPVARSMSVSSTSSSKCNIIQTTKISTLIPKSSSISSKAGSFSKSFSYPSNINNVPSSRSFLHTSLASHLARSEMPAVINGGSGYERTLLTKTVTFPSSYSLQRSTPVSSTTHHRSSSSSKHNSKDGDKLDKNHKNKVIPPLTIPKSCLVATTLKLQRSPGSTDYIFAPLSHYGPTSHHNGERSKSKESKHNGSRGPSSAPSSTDDRMVIRERQRVPTIKISDINRNPIIVDSNASGNSGSGGNRHNPPYRSYSIGSSRSSSSENGSARTHSRGGSDSSSPTGSSDKSDRSPARDTRRPSDSELLMSHHHWHGYTTAADLLFNGFKLPTHPKFHDLHHDLHYDTDAMPLDYSQSSSKS